MEWIKEAIEKEHIKYYDYGHFFNMKEVGIGGFGKVYRANYRNLEQYLALKSFTKPNSVTLNGIVREVVIICNIRKS